MKAVFRVGLATLALLVLWAVVVFVGTSEGWWKQTLAPRGDTAGFMDAAAKLVDSSNTGNAVFAVIDDGSVHGVHAVSVGEAVDVNTVFQTASLSKWITAWGVMALVQEGKLDLDAPVSTYLTRWTLPESKFDNNKVTARRLLSHTAGLTDGLGYAGFAPNVAVQSLEESLKRPADASPGASGIIEVGIEPGSEWRYSGGGYAILQLLIEEVSGESFEGFMQRVIFRPLGMVHSSYNWTPAEGSTLATFYDVDSKPSTHLPLLGRCGYVAVYVGVRPHAFRSGPATGKERRADRARRAWAINHQRDVAAARIQVFGRHLGPWNYPVRQQQRRWLRRRS